MALSSRTVEPTPLLGDYQLRSVTSQGLEPGSFRLPAVDPVRAEAKRKRVWEGQNGATSWYGFLWGPLATDAEPVGQEYAVNCKFFRHLCRIACIALRDFWVWAILFWLLFSAAVEAALTVARAQGLGALFTSICLTYLQLLDPMAPEVLWKLGAANVTSEMRDEVQRFQRAATTAARQNLFGGSEGGAWSPVCWNCSIHFPEAWLQAGLPTKELWSVAAPTGWTGVGGLLGSFISWTLIIAVFTLAVQTIGSILAVRMRVVVTRYIQEELFRSHRLYDIVVLNKALDNYDQRLTDDLMSTLMTGVLPMLSISFYVLSALMNLHKAFANVSQASPQLLPMFMLTCFAVAASALVAFVTPMNRISRLLYTQKHFEGDYRWLHCRLMEHCEAVAFYKGEAYEEAAADAAFDRVCGNFSQLTFYAALLAGLQAFFTKGLLYIASFGLIYCGSFDSADLVLNMMACLNGGFSAVMQIPQTYLAIGVAGGPCHRVGELLEAVRSVPSSPRHTANSDEAAIRVNGLTAAPPSAPELVLFKRLTFTVQQGDSTAIVGPSGCGKSSLLRVLAGLWPVQEGTLQVPSVKGAGGVIFSPQRPYVTHGSLLEQVLYPLGVHEANDAYRERARQILEEVGLSEPLEEWGLESEVDWQGVLGPGELQRLAFARILLHRPRFALLDEATSAIDLRGEAKLMKLCDEAGITAISVCHRPSAIGLHKRVLRYTGATVGAAADESSWVLEDSPKIDQSTAKALLAEKVANGGAISPQAHERETPRAFAESGGGGSDFLRRFRFLLRLAIPDWSGCPAKAVYVAMFSSGVAGIVLITGTMASGGLINDLSVGRHTWSTFICLMFFILQPVVLFVVHFSRCWMSQALSQHIRRCAGNLGHLFYFTPRVPYLLNAQPNEVSPGSQPWQPDQRLQQDTQQMVDLLTQSAIGGQASQGLMGHSVMVVMELLYALVISWLVAACFFAVLAAEALLGVLGWGPAAEGSARALRAEGNFRVAHARIREFAESIVFYNGEATEAARVTALLNNDLAPRMYWNIARCIPSQFMGVLMVLTTNIAPVAFAGMVVLNIPEGGMGRGTLNAVTWGGVISFFVTVAGSLGEVIGDFTNMGPLAGRVHRVCGFLEAAEAALVIAQGRDESMLAPADVDNVYTKDLTVSSPPLALPDGRVSLPRSLLTKLSLEFPVGCDVVVQGSCGVGKSSLFRVLAGLWTPSRGRCGRPPLLSSGSRASSCSLFLPQAPYTTEGPLRDQVRYPLILPISNDDDQAVLQALHAVGLHYLVQRWGLNKPSCWSTHLSGGEMQRLGFARLLYHRPTFGFLDEATSALDVALEQQCMAAARSAGVSIISVSHRETALADHSYILRLHGDEAGTWELLAPGTH